MLEHPKDSQIKHLAVSNGGEHIVSVSHSSKTGALLIVSDLDGNVVVKTDISSYEATSVGSCSTGELLMTCGSELKRLDGSSYHKEMAVEETQKIVLVRDQAAGGYFALAAQCNETTGQFTSD